MTKLPENLPVYVIDSDTYCVWVCNHYSMFCLAGIMRVILLICLIFVCIVHSCMVDMCPHCMLFD